MCSATLFIIIFSVPKFLKYVIKARATIRRTVDSCFSGLGLSRDKFRTVVEWVL